LTWKSKVISASGLTLDEIINEEDNMELTVVYKNDFKENQGVKLELDRALELCLQEFGFKFIGSGYHIKSGVRDLSFKTNESLIKGGRVTHSAPEMAHDSIDVPEQIIS